MDNTIPTSAAALLDMIGNAEAPKGYDTLYGNNQDKINTPITKLKIDDIIRLGPTWTKDFGSSACGRYQFLSKTLKGLRKSENLSGSELFDNDFQDRLGYALLDEIGYEKFLIGRMTVNDFGLALAKQWASFPVLVDGEGKLRFVHRGETYYAGVDKNKALLDPKKVEALLKEIGGAEAIEEQITFTDAQTHHLLAHAVDNGFAKPIVDRTVKTKHESSRNGKKIDYIVIHYTTSRNLEGTIETFINGRSGPNGTMIRTSAHYIIARDGTLVQMVEDSNAAWHAGGTKNMNARSIGIEHSANDTDTMTSPQEAKSVALIRWLVHEYAIPLVNIIPHDAVHTTDCPGHLLSAYGDTHAKAVRNWVSQKIAGSDAVG